jgi:hypothetical protein
MIMNIAVEFKRILFICIITVNFAGHATAQDLTAGELSDKLVDIFVKMTELAVKMRDKCITVFPERNWPAIKPYRQDLHALAIQL